MLSTDFEMELTIQPGSLTTIVTADTIIHKLYPDCVRYIDVKPDLFSNYIEELYGLRFYLHPFLAQVILSLVCTQ